MRILHIVTLVSPDGAFGGPLRVALNECAELSERGHDVTLAASARGYDALPTAIEGVSTRLFGARTAVPKIGFAGLCSPGLQHWVRRNSERFDIAHIHLARDFVTLPAARALQKRSLPVVCQTHGMIDKSARILSFPLDALWTKPVLKSAEAVLHLNTREADRLGDVAGRGLRLHELPNGVSLQPRRTLPVGPPPEVLFLARLHARKRPDTFVKMADRLLSEGCSAHFAVVGPDEGEAKAVDTLIKQAGHGSSLIREGPVAPADVIDRMQRAAVFVLPAVNEPFGMTVIEAMSVGVPVVVTHTCGLAALVRSTGSGVVVDHSTESLVDAVRMLIDNPARAEAMGRRGHEVVATRLSMASVVDRLEAIYREAGASASHETAPRPHAERSEGAKKK
jgi:glycosyltransferase involved in cell wall biosynthesis